MNRLKYITHSNQKTDGVSIIQKLFYDINPLMTEIISLLLNKSNNFVHSSMVQHHSPNLSLITVLSLQG